MARDRIIPAAPLPDHWILVENGSAEECPAESIIEVTGATENPDILAGQQPAAAGISRLGITRSAIAASAIGHVCQAGQLRCRYKTRSDGYGPDDLLGQRLGATKDQWYATYDPTGPLLVEKILTEDPGGEATGCALVRIVGRL